jgi:hypothetical protein
MSAESQDYGKLKLCLSDLQSFIGIIRPCNSNVIWTNNPAGRYEKVEAQAEGVFVPLDPNRVKYLGVLDGFFQNRPSLQAGNYDIQVVETLLYVNPSLPFVPCRDFCTARLHPGWIPLRYSGDPHDGLLGFTQGTDVILVFPA